MDELSIFDSTYEKYILDMTCGGRSIWFQKNHPHTIFFDKRDADYAQVMGTNPSERHIHIHPDVLGNFTVLPFEDSSFNLVVFDPPHLVQRGGENSWTQKKYGYYETEEEALRSAVQGIREGMRVLKPRGVLIFKWAETSIATRTIIDQCGYTPLFGHRSGKKSGTHWMCFMKE